MWGGGVEQPQDLESNIDSKIKNKSITECDRVKEVREYLLSHINWDCEIKTRFLDKNLGCKYGVSSAITWFFENEEKGIILEDDCVPNISFFKYCDTLLEKYKNNDNIFMISGFSALDFDILIKREIYTDYFFSKYAHIWGWASWRRAWNKYILEFSLNDFNKINNFFNKHEYRFWHNIALHLESINTWDFQFVLSIWLNNGLCIYPKENMIKNIGFNRDDATHTTGDSIFSNMKTYEIKFPLTHPKKIQQDKKLDRINCQINFCDITPSIKRIIPRLKNSIKKRIRKINKK